MPNQDDITKLAITVASSFALAFVIYNIVLSFRESGLYSPDLRRKRKRSTSQDALVHLLKALDEDEIDKSSLVYILSRLVDLAAFSEVQEKINQLGYLQKISNTLNYPDQDVKIQASLLINNLSLNEKNQATLKECIPVLVSIIKSNVMNESSVSLFAAVLNALTNLTTLNDSHQDILKHIHVLCELLQECDVVQIKVQVLKVLVNLSTNDKLCENMLELDAQLLHSVEPFISPEVEEKFLLRAVSCCANVLTSLHRRWQYGKQPCVATPEFVNEKLRENLVRLTSHESQDIRLQAGRSLVALRTPVQGKLENSLDEIDILEVLKI